MHPGQGLGRDKRNKGVPMMCLKEESGAWVGRDKTADTGHGVSKIPVQKELTPRLRDRV